MAACVFTLKSPIINLTVQNATTIQVLKFKMTCFTLQIFLAHFRHPERQGEEGHYKSWYEERHYTLVSSSDNNNNKQHFFEGGGDSCFSSPDKFWAGYGFRTNKEVLCV